jgi:hypothetical protein
MTEHRFRYLTVALLLLILGVVLNIAVAVLPPSPRGTWTLVLSAGCWLLGGWLLAESFRHRKETS